MSNEIGHAGSLKVDRLANAQPLMLWINGSRHDFSTDEAFDHVVGVAAGDISLEDSAVMTASRLVKR